MQHYGVLGRTLAHSWSPDIHKSLGSYEYRKYEIEPDNLEAFLKEGDWSGLNVTIPYKKIVASEASELGEEARRLGAANTLTRQADGTYRADNTDLFGFSYMLRRFAERHIGTTQALKGMNALVFGSGGAAQAVVAALEDEEITPHIISRTGSDTYETILEKHLDTNLIVNTTPVGMYPNCPNSPVSIEVLRALPCLKGVLDIIYNPERTKIMLDAEKLGIPSESGLVMLVAQAFRSSEIWQEKQLDPRLIDEIEGKLLSQMRNIVLIGMPGSGKTSTGRELASLLNRKHVDLDKAFLETYSKSAAEVIETKGEDEFRKMETAIAAKYCSQSGLVISCGGGIVTRPENYDLLHQNAVIIMIDRELEQLSSKGRPLSKTKGISALAEERMPLYKAWADMVQTCTGSAHGDAIEIAQQLDL